MMRRLHWSCSTLLILLSVFQLEAQSKLNMDLLGVEAFAPVTLNDIWGYTDQEENEFALVGMDTGFAVVNVTNPLETNEEFRIYGPPSTWRDIKTWDHYAYVVHDNLDPTFNGPPQGLLIVDLDSLENPHYESKMLAVDLDTIVDTMWRAHNLYIDEKGIMYIFGSNVGRGGALMFDVSFDPWNPIYLGIFNDHYLHDGMARGDTLWGAALYFGRFLIIDVKSKRLPITLGSGITRSQFTHNCWISDDGKTLFTTDERPGAYVGSYDVSSPTSVQGLSRVQRLPGYDLVPHNVHVKGDYLVTSYYTGGVQIVNAARPDVLVEVGYYDTYPQDNSSSFRGNWGVYPYLPSGNIIATDRDNGLFVLSAQYTDAAYGEFQINDSLTGERLIGAELHFKSLNDKVFTNYWGQVNRGIYKDYLDTVTISMEGYQTQTRVVPFTVGQTRSFQ
ncbi:MAG: choice-of-anchor B family protein, partial [Schleiferiaceae bacterium]|nr:choice-of-anchor B family protein [Schleiferiaceae bacterium]